MLTRRRKLNASKNVLKKKRRKTQLQSVPRSGSVMYHGASKLKTGNTRKIENLKRRESANGSRPMLAVVAGWKATRLKSRRSVKAKTTIGTTLPEKNGWPRKYARGQ
jgi:hypothetical protein